MRMPAERRFVKILLFGLLSGVLMISGCTGVPEGTRPVDNFELQRYLGTWYEIARFDHRFERGLDCVSAHYSLRDDGGVRVLNQGVRLADNELREAEGRAYFVDESDVGHLKVSFFGPFYSSYVIHRLDTDYQWALVSGYNRKYLWILARNRQPEPDLVAELTAHAEALGFDTQGFISVEQGEVCESWYQNVVNG